MNLKWVWLGLLVIFAQAEFLHSFSQTTVTTTKNEAWVDFPESIDFRLAATSSSPIESVQLEYGIEMLSCGAVSTIVTPEIAATTELDMTWRWNLLEDTFVPPGSTFWWQWHIETADGETLTTERETAVFLDSWFVWQTISENNISVSWYRGPNSLGQQMLDAASESIDQLGAETGLYLSEPTHLYLYDESFDLQASVPGAPAWAGGVAFPEHNIVLITANPDYLNYAEDTTRHEIAHIVIGRLTFNCTNNLPTWLNEGLAMVAEGYEDENAAARLTEAIENDTVLTIPQLEGSFSIHGDRARLSYAQSYSLVQYLLDSYGQEKMLTLLTTFQQGATPDEALQSTYDVDTNRLEEDWRVAVGALPRVHAADEIVPTAIATLSLVNPKSQSTTTPLPTQTTTKMTTTPMIQATDSSQPTQTTVRQATRTPVPLSSIEVTEPNNKNLFLLFIAGVLLCVLIFGAIYFYQKR